MATRNLISRSSIGPGEFISPWITLDDAVKLLGHAVLTINPHPQDWNDPTLILTVTFEYSTDAGATPQHLSSVTMFGNTFDHFGNLPSLVPGLNAVPQGGLVRGKLTLNKQLRIGLDGQV